MLGITEALGFCRVAANEPMARRLDINPSRFVRIAPSQARIGLVLASV